MTYKVSPADITNLRFSEPDRTASILQNVAVILATRQGTVPLDRSLGLPQQFLDKPAPVAKALLLVEVKEAVEEYEPRAEVVGVTSEDDPSRPGRLNVTVEVKICEEY